MQKPFFKKIFLFLIFITSFNVLLFSETSLKNVRVGVIPLNHLMDLNEENQPVNGYAFEYIQTVAAFAGWKVEYIPFNSILEANKAFLNGDLDLLYDIDKTPNRMNKFLFPRISMNTRTFYLYGNKNNKELTSDEVLSLNGKKVAVSIYDVNELEKWCKATKVKLQYFYYDTNEEKSGALKNGSVDLLFDNNLRSKNDYSVIVKVSEKDTYLVANYLRPDLLEEIDKVQRDIFHSDPFFKSRLGEKYYTDSVISKSFSKEEKEWLEEHESVKIACLKNDWPFSYFKENENSVEGVAVTITDLWFERLGLSSTLNHEYYLYNSLQDMICDLQNGKVDIVFPYYHNFVTANEQNVIISSSFFSVNMAFLLNKDSIKHNSQKNIALTESKLVSKFMDEYFPNVEIEYYDTFEDCVEAVRKGKAYSTIDHIEGIQKVAQLDRKLEYNVLNNRCEVCYAVKPENKALLSIINKGNLFVTSSEINAILMDYNSDSTFSLLLFLKYNIYFFVFAVIAFLLIIFLWLRSGKINRKLKNASNAKSTFLFNMSHDIRTPMNAIIGFTDIAEKHLYETDKVKDCLVKVRSASGHLLNLINDVLEMSKIESGKIEINYTPADIYRIGEDITPMIESLAESKNIKFNITFGRILNRYVYLDSLHMNQVFMNLVSNAIKYTPENGKVILYIEQLEKPEGYIAQYRFIVRDTGIGMREAYQQHMFEQFSRERTSTESKQQGTGLGLAISKSIIDALGGDIQVESYVGKGSKFTVTIPIKIQKDIKKTDVQTQKDKNEIVSKDKVVRLVNKKVLIVEDNELNREIEREILEDDGMIVEIAENGAIAVNLVKEKGIDYFDFILMDIQMPVMDGYEATKKIRAFSGGGEQIPIIAVSANAFAEDKEKSLKSGMNAHIAKPINVEELKKALQEFAR